MQSDSQGGVELQVGGLRISSPVGLVAGNGTFPLEFARYAAAQGIRVVAVAHRGEADPTLEQLVSHCLWVKVGELSKTLDFFATHKVKQAAFAGGIRRINLFGGVKLDLRAMALLARLRSVKDDVLLRGLAAEFEGQGIEVFSAHHFLKDSVPSPGCLTKRALSSAESRDAEVGWEAAAQIGLSDIGQSVVVKDGTIVAVEAVEGTDRCIERAGALAGPGCTVVKRAKPQQDLRLDLPTIGPQTIATMERAGASALVIESGKSLLLDRHATVTAADRAGVAIVVVERFPI
ncbi:MAG: LpxI family protein [Proteobacteria bacterium]|nr:LpxI family protein [Pseudomonadota bacterium]